MKTEKNDLKLRFCLHEMFEVFLSISRQNFLHESCQILNVDESGHKDHLIWIYNEQVRAILVKLVKYRTDCFARVK